MRVATGFGCIMLLVTQILCVGSTYSGSPGYKTVYVSKRKLPLRQNKLRFKGNIYSDGSISWFVSRGVEGRWTNWAPVSELLVPPHLVKQLKSQIARRVFTRGRPVTHGTLVEEALPALHEEPESYPSAEVQAGPAQPSTSHSFGRQFTWEEESPGKEASPLELRPASPAPEQGRRSYNMGSGSQPTPRQHSVATRRLTPTRVVHRPQTRLEMAAAPSAGPETDLEIARYFEEQNTPPISGGRGFKDTIMEAIRSSTPELELVSPISGQQAPQRVGAAPLRGISPMQSGQPSNYDLGRMQWMFFLTSYDPRQDNIRIIKRVPPLGMKLSRNSSECTRNYYKAFQLKYLTISGMMYSKKINKSVSNLIQKELKQWCNGMMTSWYQKLQENGLAVPRPSIFNR